MSLYTAQVIDTLCYWYERKTQFWRAIAYLQNLGKWNNCPLSEGKDSSASWLALEDASDLCRICSILSERGIYIWNPSSYRVGFLLRYFPKNPMTIWNSILQIKISLYNITPKAPKSNEGAEKTIKIVKNIS